MYFKSAILLLIIAVVHTGYTYIITPTEKQIVFPIQALNKEDNESFVRITENRTKIVRCPLGSTFNNDNMICQFEEIIKQPCNRKTLKPLHHCPGSGEQTVYPNPDDCKSYILCGSSGSYIRPCPANLIFNSELLICDVPQKNCCCEYKEEDQIFFESI